MGLRQLDSDIAEPAVQAVPLDAIDFDDATFRVRVHVDHAELIPSLRQQGQLAPVHLRASAIKAAPLQIVCGFRRLLAMRELDVRTVQARIHGALSDEDALRLAIADNSHHDSLTDLDRGHAIALLRERHGHTLASAAATLHLSTRHTRRLEKLTEFPAALRAAISVGRLKSVHAMVIMAHFVQREVNPESAIDGLLAQLPATVLSAARLRDRLKAGDYVNDSRRGGPDRVDGQAPGPRLYAVRSGGARLKPVNILPGTLDETTKAAFSRELEALITLISTGSLTPHATAAPDEALAADAASSVHRVTPHSGGVHRVTPQSQAATGPQGEA
jgi:ParB/RepB/Spo0J family partition protein